MCVTYVRILKDKYPVEKELIIRHEPFGVIEKLGTAMKGYRERQHYLISNVVTSCGYVYD
ncbi:MAG: hypothetical protein ABI045_02100 [Flavobacteriales bacterium]